MGGAEAVCGSRTKEKQDNAFSVYRYETAVSEEFHPKVLSEGSAYSSGFRFLLPKNSSENKYIYGTCRSRVLSCSNLESSDTRRHWEQTSTRVWAPTCVCVLAHVSPPQVCRCCQGYIHTCACSSLWLVAALTKLERFYGFVWIFPESTSTPGDACAFTHAPPPHPHPVVVNCCCCFAFGLSITWIFSLKSVR